MDNYQNENNNNNGYYGIPETQVYNQQNNCIPQQADKVSVGFCILGWFIPLFALIYFLTKKSERPKCAKAVGICGLVGVLVIITTFTFAGTVFKTVFDNVDFSDSSIVEKTQEDDNWNDFEFAYDDKQNDKSDNGFDNYASNSENNTTNAYSYAANADDTSRKLGGAKQGYLIGLEGTWMDFRDDEVQDKNMVQYSNGNEIITMYYYDGTGCSKEDIRNAVSASVDNIIANKTDIVSNPKRRYYLYPDFYAESIYTKNSEGYQLLTLLFQSDESSDMIYLAIESPFMSDHEFENFASQVIACHSFVPYPLFANYSFIE